MLEEPDHFLTSLYVHNAFAVRDLEIPIEQDGERRHLLLTGPNGSGKSSILQALWAEIQAYPSGPVVQWRGNGNTADLMAQQLRTLPPSAPERASVEQARVSSTAEFERYAAMPLVEPRGLPATIDVTRTILSLVPAHRSLRLTRPAGPNRFEESEYLRGDGAASMLLQFFVNLRTEQAYAREDGDDDAADRIGRRFDGFQQALRTILDDEDAHLTFDRPSFEFSITLGDGRTVGFDELPDGISSILFMWASLMIPAEAIRRAGVSDPPGWVLIDEPEQHLHARLQEMVLPFLTQMFPNIQFIVATHAPAVLASIPNATIFDLGSRESLGSADLRGVRYGSILKEHFGIETDFDLETTRKLHALKRLSDAEPAAGTEEFEQMRALAEELSDVPHLLVTLVTNKLDVA